MTDPPASAELARIIKAAEVELRQIHPGLFSPEGFQRLTERINEFCMLAGMPAFMFHIMKE